MPNPNEIELTVVLIPVNQANLSNVEDKEKPKIKITYICGHCNNEVPKACEVCPICKTELFPF